MVVSETFGFAAGFFRFAKTFAVAVYDYMADGKLPDRHQLKGRNMARTLPTDLPSIVEIKRSIPLVCFQPKVSTSMYYAVKDFIQVVVCFAIFYKLSNLTDSFILRATLMVAYWAVQGTFFTGIFVVGHDCGHGSFSDYPLLNDVVGTVMHSFLLAPYYMWKLSHKNHHKNNANLEKDEVFYPVRESEPCSKEKVLPAFGFGLGWYGYILKGYNPRAVSHFQPFHSTFAGHVLGCLLSLAGTGAMSYALFHFYLRFGFWGLFNYYVVPDFLFGSYCVVITFLQHSELNIPWYADEQWQFVRGQLSTVDRHYGPVHDLIHSIGTHQVHHLFTKIPHYHLELATEHFRKAFPDLVRICDEPIIKSFIRMFRVYDAKAIVPDDAKVYYYD